MQNVCLQPNENPIQRSSARTSRRPLGSRQPAREHTALRDRPFLWHVNYASWHAVARVKSIRDPLGIQAKLQWDTTLRHPGVSFALIDAKTSIQGRLEPSLSNIRASLSGQLDAQTLAPLLAQYDLFVPGIFDLRPTNLHFGADRLTMLSPSQLQWSGGQVRYILANRRYDALMPPLFASITAREDAALEANVTLSSADAAPLLILRLNPSGSVYLGVTRGMLHLANYPWTGNEAETELIFEVERGLAQPLT